MELTKGQLKGLNIAVERFKNREKYTVISGYAGTGKSTLVKVIIEALADYGIDPERDVVYTSFTGKATQVLLQKGNKNVKTLHKLLYKSTLKPDGTYLRMPVGVTQRIVIVDEVSMVPKSLMDLLLKQPCHIICLGDNFQLPPVNPKEDNHLLDNPHIILDEIMRQEADSEIIQITSLIRGGDELPYFDGKEVKVISRNQLNTGMLTWADQILVAKNQTRIDINNQMRELLGYSGVPQDGEKVICLKNYWEVFSDNEEPLVNGTIGFLKNPYESFIKFPPLRGLMKRSTNTVCGGLVTDTGSAFKSIEMDKEEFTKGQFSLNSKDMYKLLSNRRTMFLVPKDFTYAYAITCHKAQGSQWDKVLVIEENFPFDAEEHARWLYTAATRAAKQLIIVR